MRKCSHLRRLRRVWLRGPVFLITCCVREHRPVLAEDTLPSCLLECLREARDHYQWLVGGHVVMPDHIHFFCTPRQSPRTLSSFVGRFKSRSTRMSSAPGHAGALWQREFHDHLLRSEESYARKWLYVRMNPVRAGLCERPEDWPHSGEIDGFWCAPDGKAIGARHRSAPYNGGARERLHRRPAPPRRGAGVGAAVAQDPVPSGRRVPLLLQPNHQHLRVTLHLRPLPGPAHRPRRHQAARGREPGTGGPRPAAARMDHG